MSIELKNVVHAAGSVVGATGARAAGEGFASARTGAGVYTITLDRLIDSSECEVIVSPRGAPATGSRAALIAAGRVIGATGVSTNGYGAASARTGAGVYTLTLPGAGIAAASLVIQATPILAGALANIVVSHTGDAVKTVETFNAAGGAADIDFHFAIWRTDVQAGPASAHAVHTSDTVKTIQVFDAATLQALDQDFDFAVLRTTG